MKKTSVLVLALALTVLMTACSKQPAPTTPVPPVTDSTVLNSNKLLKTEFTRFTVSGTSNLDSFAYDNLKRISYYSQYIATTANNGTNLLFEYQFFFTGNNKYPASYTYSQKMINPSPALSSTLTMRDTLIYNSGSQLIMDSMVYTSLPPGNAAVKIKKYSYSTNLAIAATYYPNDSAGNRLDSIFFDSKGNAVQRTQGNFDKNHNYTPGSITTSVYGAGLNPFKTSAVGIAIFTAYGIFASTNLEISSLATRFSSNAGPATETSNLVWLTDSNGLLQQLTYTSSSTFSNLTTVYSYY